ncbi:inositol polyphosphate 4-phosphatase type II isoform X2 [Chiloscyllium plagiosum]|uniref:inositol polyphosphate 4-phosphatase type II isoform X2 n=1 Tax=Chiloscyllium plagiosum TaxID=36176 RepID=UPI001CB7E63A|nr:inositol polyphosphate 4-phosphatase type II isoform X2 [Chiloscyllium plagiosum]XP_043530083.1 inositol polyphosphate 4-phosphatase type II isoform X2 [Chiloscyllium plagiosum]
MKFNSAELSSFAQKPSVYFEKEGLLKIHRKSRTRQRKHQELTERWCRLKGNLLFLMKNRSSTSDLAEVIVLERCDIVECSDNRSAAFTVKFQSGEPEIYLEAVSKSDCEDWIAALREANSEGLQRRIVQLQQFIMEIKANTSPDGIHQILPLPEIQSPLISIGKTPFEPKLEFSLACKELVATTRERKPNSFVQITIINPTQQSLIRYSNTETVEGTRDPVFLTGATFPPGYPIYEETRVKLTVYDVKEKSQETRSFLGSATFAVGDLLKSDEQTLTINLSPLDGSSKVGTIVVSNLKMGENETEETDQSPGEVSRPKPTSFCGNLLHRSIKDPENSSLLDSVFKNIIWKVYRLPTANGRWLCVREQMAETTLSFLIPKQMIALFIQEDMRRLQDLEELGELSAHWDTLRQNVTIHYQHMISSYKEMLTELNKFSGSSFKPSCSRGEKKLEFIPVNLHLQRMHVQSSSTKTDGIYDVVTIGAPAAHIRGFRNGGLRRQLYRFEGEKRNSSYQYIYYSPEDTTKAKEVITNIYKLQPLILSNTELLLTAARQHSTDSLKDSLKTLSEITEQFVHAFEDQLLRSALLALHKARPSYINKRQPNPTHNPDGSEQQCENNERRSSKDSIPHHAEYDEEDWDRVWVNVGKSLNCIIAMVDRLLEQVDIEQQCKVEPSAVNQITSSASDDWYEGLYPLVVTLKDCVKEVIDRAKKAMVFVLLQDCGSNISQALALHQRRDVVFSQALAGLVCGFVIKLHTCLHDQDFLLQLHTVGLLVQFEGLLSTYSEEIGMLEDMSVAIIDLQKVTFKVGEAHLEESASTNLFPVVTGIRDFYTVEVQLPSRLFEVLPQEIKDGKLLRVHPVFFNIGINEQQTLAERFGDISLQEIINQENFKLLSKYYKIFQENLTSNCLPQFQTQIDIKELFQSLSQNIQVRKRKNVEVLKLAASICRRLNGIRVTSCKSAKDRTSMSVTLEQCVILQEEHSLHPDYFARALDCMRREGCRIENAQKNINCRKYAFNTIQLMAFPKYYRPPDGTYGKADT